MRRITRKSEVKAIMDEVIAYFNPADYGAFLEKFNQDILMQKVKFPLLEYCGKEIYQKIKPEHHVMLCDQIEELKTEGGNVILGIILQQRMQEHYKESIDKATAYISNANIWYVCDIIGERTYGYALLNYPEKTLPEIKKLSQHPVNWVIRALGAGIHYSIKKGAEKEDVEKCFQILLTMANTKDKEIRQGVGWAAKTTAKFHPDIIEKYQNQINNREEVASWFGKKIEIGLSRHHYAKRS